MSIKETKDGATIKIYVKPNSPKFKIELDEKEFVVHATEAPEKGKVNKEIIKEFSRLLHAKVNLASGATSRQKQLFVQGITKSQAEELLAKP
jgi:hypothetical protein